MKTDPDEEERQIDRDIEEKYITRRQRARMISRLPEKAMPLGGSWENSFTVEDVYPKAQTVFLYYNMPSGTTKSITEDRE